MRISSHKITLIALASITVFAMSTGISSASPAPQTENLVSLGSSQGNSEESINLTAEIHQAERNKNGDLLSVTWSITNSGNERTVLTWINDRSYAYEGPYFSGVTAVSLEESTRYHPIMDGLGACLCSGKISDDFIQRVEPNEKIAYWSLFSVPEDVETVTVEIPNFDPIEDIPIS